MIRCPTCKQPKADLAQVLACPCDRRFVLARFADLSQVDQTFRVTQPPSSTGPLRCDCGAELAQHLPPNLTCPPPVPAASEERVATDQDHGLRCRFTHHCGAELILWVPKRAAYPLCPRCDTGQEYTPPVFMDYVEDVPLDVPPGSFAGCDRCQRCLHCGRRREDHGPAATCPTDPPTKETHPC